MNTCRSAESRSRCASRLCRSRVQLGEHIVQQQRRLGVAGQPKAGDLDQLQRDRRAALLAGRAVVSQPSAAHLEHQIVAVRSDRGQRRGRGHRPAIGPAPRPTPPGRPARRAPVPERRTAALAQALAARRRTARRAWATHSRRERTSAAPAAARASLNARAMSEPALPQGAVPLRQRRPVAGERPQIAAIRQREHPVQVLTPLRGRSRCQPHVRREKGHREPVTHRVGETADFLAVHRDPLLPRRVGGAHRASGAAGRCEARPQSPAARAAPARRWRPGRTGTGPGSRSPRAGWSCPARWRPAAPAQARGSRSPDRRGSDSPGPPAVGSALANVDHPARGAAPIAQLVNAVDLHLERLPGMPERREGEAKR